MFPALSDLFPNSKHVKDFGLESSGDEIIWNYAMNNGFAIVSKDLDFRHFSFFHGAPPKVISIGRGDCSTFTTEKMLRESFYQITAFLQDPSESFLILE